MTDDLATAPATPTEAAAKAAHQVAERIKETVRTIRNGWLRLAEDLHGFQRLEMYRDLGFDSFEQWLATPEVELSRRHVYYLLEIWRELVEKRDVPRELLADVEVSKVQEVLPAIRRGFVDADEALGDVRALGSNDLREKYRGAGGTSAGAPAGSRPIDPANEKEWAVCETCGQRYEVRPS